MFDEKTKLAIAKTASSIDVPAAALMAVAEVESGGRLSAKVCGKNEPLIRFEGHYFDRFLRGDARLEARAEGLANPKAGAVKNARSQAARWKVLHRAIRINRIAALSSTSWGLGQVMGAHWKWLGYGSADALVEQARSGVEGQVQLMARYIKRAGLVKALQERDWAAFARRYNGPSYRKNRYDKKMHTAFLRYTKEAEAQLLPQVAKESMLDGKNLMFGARGSEVKTLQKALTRLGYVLVADGLFGLVTDRVIKQFQRDHFLLPTGSISQAERDLIFGKSNPVAKVTLKVGTRVSKAAKKVGSRSNSVLKAIRSGLRKRLLSISRRIT